MNHINGLDVPAVLGGLKDFQRRTVDYVFKRMYLDEDPAYRFLVADEVGLGKTLVARGLIARTLDHLRDKVERIDVVYVCSNAAIAQQNINRLNVLGTRHFQMATRLTLLPMQLDALTRNRVNFVSFTPGTTFDMKSSSGIGEERALLFHLLRPHLPGRSNGLLNVMHAAMDRENFRGLVSDIDQTDRVNKTLAARFVTRFTDNPDLRERLEELTLEFHRARSSYPWEMQQPRLAMIRELRHLLAQVCVDALEPDLVIMDEFQRFKDLLSGESEAAQLASTLMSHESPDGGPVRVALLSATPYRPLTFDDDREENHHRDFIGTLQFLLGSEDKVERLQEELKAFRNGLFAPDSDGDTRRARDRVQDILRSVMVRTERVGSTAQLDAMVTMRPVEASIEPCDLRQMRMTGRLAGAVGSHDVVEYWKSGPYALEFMKDYDLKRKLEDQLDSPLAGVAASLKEADGTLLRRSQIQRYSRIDPANGRLRALAEDTIGAGLWRLLWLPPAMPYTEMPEYYPRKATKALVFSSWAFVPEVIAGLLSYDAERLALEHGGGELPRYSNLSKARRPLLRFTIGEDGRETGMSALLLLYPCVTLASAVDPLRMATEAGRALSLGEARAACAVRVRELLQEVEGYSEGTGAGDPQWYWAAAAKLDGSQFPLTAEWIDGEDEWPLALADEDDPGAILRRHTRRFAAAARGQVDLGPAPADLVDVLVDVALGSPAVAALRALSRVAPDLPLATYAMLQPAAHIAAAFRSRYNVPETIALLRGADDTAYWRAALQHGVEGNIQAVLDEYAHVLRESLGLLNQPGAEVAAAVSAEMHEALRIRSARVVADEIKVTPGNGKVAIRQFSLRSRFALRFADSRDEGSDTLARVGVIRKAFNSPFRPFVLATTSVGQEGLDFHQYCHAVYHWNLPSNPVDMEQREGRVHRYKGHAVRKNVAQQFGLSAAAQTSDPWEGLFDAAVAARGSDASDLIPYWIYPIEGGATVERRVPVLPFSKEVSRIRQLQKALAVYRLAFGQPRQEDLLEYLQGRLGTGLDPNDLRISLHPPAVSLQIHDEDRMGGAGPASVIEEALEVISVPAAATTQHGEATFLRAVLRHAGRLTPDDLEAVETVLEFAMRNADAIDWGEGGSMAPLFTTLAPVPCFVLNADGRLALALGELMRHTAGAHFAREWVSELQEVFGVDVSHVSPCILAPEEWRAHVSVFLDTLSSRLMIGPGVL